MKSSQALKERKEVMTALALIAPIIVIMVIFLYISFVNVLQTGFYRCNGLGVLEHLVELKDYVKVPADPKFVCSLWNIFYFIMVSFLTIPIGLVFVYILYVGVPGKKIFNADLFIPYLILTVVVGCIWRVIYDPTIGLMDQSLKMAGLGEYVKAWLNRPETALQATAITQMQYFRPFNILIMYTNITKVPEGFLETTQIDGANFRQKLFYVIIPYLKPTFTVLAVLTVTDEFRLFDLIWVMTQDGPGGASNIMTSYIYTKAFTNRNFGAGTVVSVILMLIMVATMAVKITVQKKRVGRAL